MYIDKQVLREYLNNKITHAKYGKESQAYHTVLMAIEQSNIFDTDNHLRAALKAYDYWWPIPSRRSHGRGQAEGTASCGHIAPAGAPCCQKCAQNMIIQALSGASEQSGVDGKNRSLADWISGEGGNEG